MSKSTIRNIVIALFLIVAGSASFGIMVYQVIAQGSQLNNQIEALEKERAQVASYYKLQRISGETEEEREQLRSYFLFRESDSITFLNQVEALAPETGVKLQTSGLERITERKDQSEWIKVNFSFTGSRERVQDFIQILESLPYVLRVTSIDMSVMSSTTWQVNLTLQVRVLAYDE